MLKQMCYVIGDGNSKNQKKMLEIKKTATTLTEMKNVLCAH